MVFRLIPLFTICRNFIIICRSIRCSPCIFTDCLLLASMCRSLRWFMKWWMEGMASPRWTYRPLFCSISFARTLPLSFSWLIPSTPWTYYQGVGCVAAGNWWTTLRWFSVLWVTPLNGAYSLPPSFHGGSANFHWAVASMSQMQGGLGSHIFADYLSLQYPLLGIWNHQCRSP